MSEEGAEGSEETPLTGGRYTLNVVRVGTTVRRPVSSASSFTRALLRLLEEKNCGHVPRHLGVDEKGRDVLTFIPGWVPAKFQYFEDQQIETAARIMRQFHDATRGSQLAGQAEVVCHNDPGPNNTVFQDGTPVAFIDFDFAAPGDPIEDLAYLGWTWCVSSKASRGPADVQARQLRAMGAAYGLLPVQASRLVESMIERQGRNVTFWSDRMENFEGPPTPKEEIQERVAWSRREMEFTSAHRSQFARALR
jgi:Ser/Thr protein kinase RdoA (MazF antagonist)